MFAGGQRQSVQPLLPRARRRVPVTHFATNKPEKLPKVKYLAPFKANNPVLLRDVQAEQSKNSV